MDKHAIRIEINNLLDAHCKECKLVVGQDTLPICRTCSHFKILRQLGDQLLEPEGKTLAALTVEKYVGFVKQGLATKDIAERSGVMQKSIYAWKHNHKEEIEKALKSSEIAPKAEEKAPKATETEKTPNQVLVKKISTKCKEQEKEIAELKRQVDSLVEDNAMFETDNKNLARQLDNESLACKEMCKKIDALNNAADDLEKEIAQLKDDNNDLQQQLTYAQRTQDAAEKKATELQAQYSAATAFIVTLLAR